MASSNITITTTTSNITATKHRGRNWTKEETDLFIDVITDPNDDYALILEKKALKKSSNKMFANEVANFIRKGKTMTYAKLSLEGDIGIKKLQTKYKDIKDRWRKITDAARRGSGEEGATDERWYRLINPILAEQNGDLGEIVNGPLDTSLCDDDDDETDDDVDDDILINDLVYEGPPTKTKKSGVADEAET